MNVISLKSSPLLAMACGVVNMLVFKIKCPECGQPAIIRKSDWKDKKLADLHCACTEVECGHTFVFNASFSHTLSPNGLTGNKLVKILINRLTPEERQFTLELLNNN